MHLKFLPMKVSLDLDEFDMHLHMATPERTSVTSVSTKEVASEVSFKIETS